MDLFAVLDTSRDDFHELVKNELENGIISDYSSLMADEIMNGVARDVLETADQAGCGVSDVRMAIGRVLLKRLGVEV